MSEANELEFIHETDALVVRVAGRYLIEHTEQGVLRIADAIRQRPVKAALIDLRGITGSITFMDRYKVGQLAGTHLRMVPIAALVTPGQMDMEQIGVTVARNRGANVELFTDLSAAQAWLASIPARDEDESSAS